MDECIFCKIANRKIPCELLYNDDLVVAINDINPLTPVHVLIIPKKHIESVADMEEVDEALAGRMVMVAKKVAQQLGTSEGGYKLLIRVRLDGGQEVPHVHMHLLGGGKMSESIKIS